MKNTYIVITGDGYWGKSDRLDEAIKNCHMYRSCRILIKTVNCDQSKVRVDDSGCIYYPNECECTTIANFKGRVSIGKVEDLD